MIATPYARRLARERRIDLAAITGTGPSRRIKASDVLAVSMAASAVPAPPAAGPATATPAVPQSQPRAAIAPAPPAHLAAELDAGPLLDLMAQIGDRLPDLASHHLVLLAAARALAGYAMSVDLGVSNADAGHDGYGLIRDAATMTLGRLAAAAQVAEARAEPDARGVLAIARTTMTAVTLWSAPVPPGWAGLLTLAPVRAVLLPDAVGNPVPGRRMGMVLSCDSARMPPRDALAVLSRIVASLESPLQLLVS